MFTPAWARDMRAATMKATWFVWRRSWARRERWPSNERRMRSRDGAMTRDGQARGVRANRCRSTRLPTRLTALRSSERSVAEKRFREEEERTHDRWCRSRDPARAAAGSVRSVRHRSVIGSRPRGRAASSLLRSFRISLGRLVIDVQAHVGTRDRSRFTPTWARQGSSIAFARSSIVLPLLCRPIWQSAGPREAARGPIAPSRRAWRGSNAIAVTFMRARPLPLREADDRCSRPRGRERAASPRPSSCSSSSLSLLRRLRRLRLRLRLPLPIEA
jgi:hypothetical protein